jgi:hypothetical protein
LRINKGNNLSNSYTTAPYTDSTGVVVMHRNVRITPGVVARPNELLLISGVLNMDTNVLTVGANFIRMEPGKAAIDGAKGTYEIINGHQQLYLEDRLFTVGEVPTL